MSREAPPWLIAALQQELKHYQALLQVCAQQKQIVDNSVNVDELMAIFKRKQQHIEKIKQIEAKLSRYSDSRSKGKLQKGDEGQGTRITSLRKRIRSLLEQIVSIEQQTQAALSERKRRIGNRLRQINHWRHTLRKYIPSSNRIPRFIDTSG